MTVKVHGRCLCGKTMQATEINGRPIFCHHDGYPCQFGSGEPDIRMWDDYLKAQREATAKVNLGGTEP